MKRKLIIVSFLALMSAARAQIAPANYTQLQTVVGSTTRVPAITSDTVLDPLSVSSFTVTPVSINGVTYSSSQKYSLAPASGGGTQWINIKYTVPAGVSSQNFYLSFLVANRLDHSFDSGLAIDKITTGGTGGTPFSEGFSSGGFGGSWGLQGSGGTFTGITNLAATDGSYFAFIDTKDTGTSINSTTSPASTLLGAANATILKSPVFSLVTGQTLSIDVAFFSNDGAAFTDFALVRLFQSSVTDQIGGTPYATLFTAMAPGAVPEPAETVLLLALGALGFARFRRRRSRVS